MEEIERIYTEIGSKVFSQNIIYGATGWVTNYSYYNTQFYENILKEFCGEYKMIDTQRTKGTPKVALVSTVVGDDRVSPYVFRSYELPRKIHTSYKGSSHYPVWAGVRASTAAPGYFHDFILDNMVHQDGGILTNNATQIAIHEAQKLWPNQPLQCVVSLGMHIVRCSSVISMYVVWV